MRTRFILTALMAIYAVSRFLQVSHDGIPFLAVVALHVLPPLLFALIHAGVLHGWRGSIVFLAICGVVGNAVENLGVRTGFPFGHYYFTDVMGPKLFVVPILLGCAYVGMGYLSWTLGRLILGGAGAPLAGARIVVAPLVASFIMVAWDLAGDPVWSTIVRAWVWLDGGAYFGVPVSNFLGWYAAVFRIYQLFALYLRGRAPSSSRLSPAFWRLAVLFYAVSAAGNLLLLIQTAGPSTVVDATGAQWKVSDITAVSALVSIFVMGAFSLLAWVRLARNEAEPKEVAEPLRIGTASGRR